MMVKYVEALDFKLTFNYGPYQRVVFATSPTSLHWIISHPRLTGKLGTTPREIMNSYDKKQWPSRMQDFFLRLAPIGAL